MPCLRPPDAEGARALPTDANGLPAGDKSGYMGKRNRSGQWKIRWFVLKDKLLQYYKVVVGGPFQRGRWGHANGGPDSPGPSGPLRVHHRGRCAKGL